MKHAEDNQLLSNDLHGGRRGRTVHDAIFHQLFTYDLTRQTKRPLATISLDAKKCYELIYPNVATITLARLGLPIPIWYRVGKNHWTNATPRENG